jgi:hypothetical protein
MRTFKDDDGRLNNFAVEPKMYQAEPISADQKRRYMIVALVGAALIGGMMVVAATVS